MDKEKLLLIKGDVTAIQHYIFSVKNKGAARLLKQRSQNVKKITEQTSNELTRELAASPLITGGGYFLLKAPKPPGWEGIWTHLRNKYETKERVGRLNLVLSYYEVPDEQEMESHYAEFRGLLEEQAGKDKLQQGKSIPGFFDPYPAPQTKEPTGTEPEDIPIWDDCDEKLIDEPHPEKGIIDFDFLASFAQQRTGSDLLAALKLDVDNLGECFKNLQTKEASDELSGRLKKFFGEKKTPGKGSI